MWCNLFFLCYGSWLSEVKKQGARWSNHTLRSGSWGSRRENGDAILIGDGACQGVQGCLGFVSLRKACQELRKTGGMNP